MSGFGFDMGVEGGDSLEGLFKAFEKLPLHMTGDVYTNALKKAAEPLKKRIDITAPEDTGDFVKTLRVAKTKFKKQGEHQVVVGFRKGTGEEGKPLKGFIAHFHEHGTSKMPAKPFMRPADEATRAQQEEIFTNEIQKEVDKRLDGL